MTFTMIGRCPRTGMLGIATATASWAVGVRVPFVRERLGAVAIMAIADQRLGPLGLRFLELGYKAPGAIEQLVAADPYHEYRQLGIVDDDGFAAARTGTMNKDWSGHHVGAGYVALGNYLTSERTVDEMERTFLARPEDNLEERLMQAIEAGRDAGGQVGGQTSAAIVVYDRKPFARVDLRVDHHDEPVAELRRVFDIYKQAIPYYDMRQVDPRVPSLQDWLAAQQRD